MNIFIMGQCTLHWGRMEFGNIGNYYIIEPFMRELYRVFPDASIKTTFQMSESFSKKEKVDVVPMDNYYTWKTEDLDVALMELAIADIYSKTGYLCRKTSFISNVLWADIVIDFSGDIWGDNADFLGDNRFLVGLCKDRVAQLLGKPTVMLAGSPGPFNKLKTKELAKEVYRHFDLVTNRELMSQKILEKEGFDLSKTKTLTCPAFLFETTVKDDIDSLLKIEGITRDATPLIGFILCGWNFIEGPFDKENRDDDDYIQFVEAVEHITENIGAKVILMSHSNGFPIPPEEFELIHGRDYAIIKQLQKIINERGKIKNVFTLDSVYDAWTTKAIIGQFDMLVSGRVHGAVAGISQNVPTVFIDYGHEPKAHKVKGFATVAGVEQYIADPSTNSDLIEKINICWKNRSDYRKHLIGNNNDIKNKARENFDLLRKIIK